MKQAQNIMRVLLILILGISQPGIAEGSGDAFIKSYLDASEALASDQALTKEQLQKLQESAESAGLPSAGFETIMNLAKETSIKSQRSTFKKVSQHAIAYAKEKKIKDLYKANCPMADADWLQRDEPVRNPYYGSKMLACGSSESL